MQLQNWSFTTKLVWSLWLSPFCFQKLNRKLVHISIGLVFMLCWPLFRYVARLHMVDCSVLLVGEVIELVMFFTVPVIKEHYLQLLFLGWISLKCFLWDLVYWKMRPRSNRWADLETTGKFASDEVCHHYSCIYFLKCTLKVNKKKLVELNINYWQKR